MNRIKLLCEFALYTALAFILGYLEMLFPLPVPFPGIKLGFANLVVILFLYRKNFRSALALSMLRNLLNAFTFGSIFSLFYSLTGSILSLLIMALFKKCNKKRFSVISVSALGGIFHNIGQLLIAGILVGFPAIRWYFPVLYMSGLATGILMGFLAKQVLKRHVSSF